MMHPRIKFQMLTALAMMGRYLTSPQVAGNGFCQGILLALSLLTPAFADRYDFPDQTTTVDWNRTGQTADASADPELINTCQEPISIELDRESFTAGTARQTLTGDDAGACALWDIQNFTIYAQIPFTVTCGSGAKFKGVAVRDLGNGDDVWDEGGCNQQRDPTWQSQHVRMESDGTIRGIYFNYDAGTRETIRHFNLQSLAGHPEIKNHTFPLLPFPGGDRVLSRPVLFVHGLGERFDTAWGVEDAGRVCSPANVSIQTVGAPGITLDFTQSYAGWKSYRILGQFDFSGTCAEDGLTRQWQSLQREIASWSISSPFLDQAPQAWEDLWILQPPNLVSWRLEGTDLVGELDTWIHESDIARDLTGAPWTVVSSRPETRITISQGTASATMIRARLAFRKAWQDVDWRHNRRVGSRTTTLTPLASIDTRAERAYRSATAPDILSRIQRLKKGADINQNGLYFFNGFRSIPTGGESQPLPWWNNAGPRFPGAPGESWTLYEALEQALTRHFGEAWKTDPSLQIDLVAHSKGGISIREMLANASGTNPLTNMPMPVGTANAANHIRRVVTVNSPHFGSVMPTDRASIPTDFNSSVGRMLDDWDNHDLELMDVTVNNSFLGSLGAAYIEMMYIKQSSLTQKAHDAFVDDPEQRGDFATAAFGIQTTPVWGALTLVADGYQLISRLPADIRLRTTGNWLKPQSSLATWEYPWGSDKIDRYHHNLDMGYNWIDRSRQGGAHLAINSAPILGLMSNYPTLPDGRDLDFLPLYSTTEGMGDLIRDLAVKNLGGMCDLSQDLRNAACYGGFEALRLEGWSLHNFIDRVDADLPLGGFLDDFTKGWLAKSDLLVQEESQKATRDGTTWLVNRHPGKFQEPRTYEVRRFLTGGKMPDAMAPHGPISTIFEESFAGQRLSANIDLVGAPWLGHDIYCALAPECQDLLSSASGHVVRLSWETEAAPAATLSQGPLSGVALIAAGIPVTGDFRYGVMPSDPEPLAMALVAQGATNPALVVSWSEGSGVTIQVGTNIQTLIPAGYVAVPRLERLGDQVAVRARAWSGTEYVKTFNMPQLGPTVNLQVMRAATSTSQPLLVGEGSIPAKYLDPRPDLQAEAWLRETRGSETAWSRPRIAIQNTGRSPIQGLTFRYRFRADPNHPPVLVAQQPALWRVEHRESDLYELVFSDPQVTIAPGDLWPLGDAAKVGLHMANWTPWDVFKDPSNDRNFGHPRRNDLIQVWNGAGHLLWGRDPGMFDLDRPEVRKVFVASREAAVGENNITKPEIEIRNDGNVPLQDLQATWWLRLPVGETPILEDWYTPASDVVLEPRSGGLWAVRMTIRDWIQPGQKVSVGSFGVRLPQYRPWDRTLSPSREGVDGRWVANPWIEVRDSRGELLWGTAREVGSFGNPGDGGDDGEGNEGTNPGPGTPLDLLVEWRDEAPWEANVVKPRVRVTNPGTNTVHGFRLEFPVVPERNLVPSMVVDPYWVPGCQGRVEVRAAETVGILDCPEVTLEAGRLWPDPVGAVFSLHYHDWSVWDRTNDPAFAGLGSTFTSAPGVRVVGPGTP